MENEDEYVPDIEVTIPNPKLVTLDLAQQKLPAQTLPVDNLKQSAPVLSVLPVNAMTVVFDFVKE
jgi:hypothetical protein